MPQGVVWAHKYGIWGIKANTSCGGGWLKNQQKSIKIEIEKEKNIH